MSSSFGYLDIILLGMIAGFIILRLKIFRKKNWTRVQSLPNFAEKKFSMPKNDTKPKEKNLEILEGNDKKEFLKELK